MTMYHKLPSAQIAIYYIKNKKFKKLCDIYLVYKEWLSYTNHKVEFLRLPIIIFGGHGIKS